MAQGAAVGDLGVAFTHALSRLALIAPGGQGLRGDRHLLRQVAIEDIEPSLAVPADDEVALALLAAKAAEAKGGILRLFSARTDELAVKVLQKDDIGAPLRLRRTGMALLPALRHRP